MSNITTIGVIGLVNAGTPILNNLNKSNKYKLVAFDIDTKKLNDIPKNIIKATSTI
jgi:UDP-N-acetyl-D-mannosaminuronate dehydrogenase